MSQPTTGASAMSLRARRRWCRVVCAVCALCACVLLSPPAPPPRAPLASALQRLPLRYWIHTRRHPRYYKNLSSCVSMPSLFAVEHAAPFWQRVTPRGSQPLSGQLLPGGTGGTPAAHVPPAPAPHAGDVLVHAAHWDARSLAALVLVYSNAPLPPLHCHLWYYGSGDPLTVPARALSPCVLQCASPAPIAPPAALSLALTACGPARTMLAVQGVPTPRSALAWFEREPPVVYNASSVGVCAVWRGEGAGRSGAPRGWGAKEDAAALAEWLLLLRHMQAARVYLYLSNEHSDVLRVVEQFTWSQESLLHVTPYQAPPGGGDGGRGDPTPYNDCVYSARAHHGWLALLDLDQIILPLREDSWPALVSRLTGDAAGGSVDVLEFSAAWFAEWLQRDDVMRVTRGAGGAGGPLAGTTPPPSLGRMLSRNYRAPVIRPLAEGVTGKLIRAARISHVGRHVWCASRDESEGDTRCSVRHVKPEVARLHVYSARCGGGAGVAGGAGGRRACRVLRAQAVRDGTLRERVGKRGEDALQGELRTLLEPPGEGEPTAAAHEDH